MAETDTNNKVEVIQRIVLQCADPAVVSELGSKWSLGPMDHLVFPFVPIQVVFLYEGSNSNSASQSEISLLTIERLQKALGHLLDYYPHLTGRLQFDPESRAAEISQFGTGAELSVARCEVQLNDLRTSGHANGRILITSLPDCGNALTPPFDPTIEGVCRDPILAIQRTQFSCGGVALGIRLHHIVCDASGFFQLSRNLAEIYRGLVGSARPILLSTPEIQSYLRGPSSWSENELQEALNFRSSTFCLNKDHIDAFSPSSKTEPPASQSGPPGNVTGRVLRFLGHELLQLKASATDPNGGKWVSKFEALSAYLYQRIYRARVHLLMCRGVPESEVPSQILRAFWGSMDLRGPTRLNLSEQYFPNAVIPLVFPRPPHSLLADGQLWQVANVLHDLVRSFKPEHTAKELKWIAAQPDKSRIKLDFEFGYGNFTVSQWSKNQMYLGVDFDVDENGKGVTPVLVSPPLTEISRVDGLAFILSTEDQLNQSIEEKLSGLPCALDVNLTLSEDLWPILDRDEQFRKHCC